MPIDYSKYPPGWLKETRPRIMARAGNCCDRCGLEHNQTVWALRFQVKENGVYKTRSIWFSRLQDAEREKFESQEVKPVRVILTIAHLDHDEDNHEVSDNRLRAWCQMCHLRYDAKEKQRRLLLK